MPDSTSTLQFKIQDLENKRYQAVIDRDFDTFEGLCHADLVYGHSGGNRDSLQMYLAKLRNGALRYHRIDHAVENILLLGNAALVVGHMTADITVDGTNKTLNNNLLAVWIKDAGEWKFVAYQPTPQTPLP